MKCGSMSRMELDMGRKYGAVPPQDLGWQIGKTAASITFVGEAETYVGTPEDKARLDAYVAKIKSGKVVLHNALTPAEYLAQSDDVD